MIVEKTDGGVKSLVIVSHKYVCYCTYYGVKYAAVFTSWHIRTFMHAQPF